MNARTQENGTVLAIAAGAAGVVGTIAAAIMSRNSERESDQDLEGSKRRPDANSRKGTTKSRKFMKQAQESAPLDVDLARRRVGELGAELTSLAAAGIGSARSRIEAGDLQGSSQRLATSLRERSRESASRAGSVGSDVAARASGLVNDARNQVPDLKERVGKAAVDARSRGSQLGEQVRERLPDLRDQVEERVAPIVKDVRKQAKPLLSDAAGVAAIALGAAGTKAQDARVWAENDALPEVRNSIAEVSHKAIEKAKVAEHVLSNVSSDASERLSGVGETIEGRSRQAATVAAKGTKDTGSLVFWTAAGAGVVFYAFLSDEQREQVKAAARRISSEAREIYRDIQGYDEEFS